MPHRLPRLFLAATMTCGLFAWTAAAASPSEMAYAVASQVFVPRYKTLRSAFDAQASAWKAGCSDAEPLRAAYHTAADAWARIEQNRFGPVARESRAERIAFWPDPRNATERGLAALIAAPDEAAHAPERMAKASVAVQGLPVIERLLFPAKEPGKPAPAPELDPRKCAIGQAVAANLAAVGAAIESEWTAPETGELARLKSAAKGDAQQDAAAATRILTDLATILQVIGDNKLAPLYGSRGKPPNKRLAEAWRSGRSDHNMGLNLETARATVTALKPFAPHPAQSLIERLETARTTIASHAGNPAGFAGLSSVKVAQYEAILKFPDALGITLGFNSLDGD